MKDKDDQPRKFSSWAAALSQLPGYPAEDAPRMPELKDVPRRQVSHNLSAEDDDE